ncbi:MAG: thiosulfate oxidation carrier protein SoxY [Gammaproteobacteria bacterium]|nr:MAG: thiosulfate oxidation carrier protein SoxY [Gammaproteobacteria bacterium]
MSHTLHRRTFLKGSLAAGTLGVAVSAGLLTPQTVLAAWNEKAFHAKKADKALSAAFGSGKTEASEKIKIKAPDIAENGAVVPVTVSSDLPGVENIAILSSANNTPLLAVYNLGKNTKADVSCRIKMAKTGDVIAVVKAGGKLYANRKGVKVTIGGCGG